MHQEELQPVFCGNLRRVKPGAGAVRAFVPIVEHKQVRATQELVVVEHVDLRFYLIWLYLRNVDALEVQQPFHDLARQVVLKLGWALRLQQSPDKRHRRRVYLGQ